MTTTIWHVGISIKGALRQKNLKGLLADGGRELSDDEVRNVLIDDLRAGHDTFVGCDNRNADGSCAGHPGDEARAA